jgi:hypothetical protein
MRLGGGRVAFLGQLVRARRRRVCASAVRRRRQPLGTTFRFGRFFDARVRTCILSRVVSLSSWPGRGTETEDASRN